VVHSELVCRPFAESPSLRIHDLAAPQTEEIQRCWRLCGQRGVVLLFLEGLPLSAARVLGPGDVPVLHQSGLCSGRKEGMRASCPCRARNPSFTGVPGIPCRFQRDTSDTPSTVPILPGL
jgi:hypothetical protein